MNAMTKETLLKKCYTQLKVTFSTIETLEKGVEYVQT